MDKTERKQVVEALLSAASVLSGNALKRIEGSGWAKMSEEHKLKLLSIVFQAVDLGAEWGEIEVSTADEVLDLFRTELSKDSFVDKYIPWLANKVKKNLTDEQLRAVWDFKSICRWAHETRTDIGSFSIEDAAAQAKSYVPKAAKKALEESSTNPVVYRFPDGYRIVQLKTDEALKHEGDRMKHCVGTYCEKVKSGRSVVYSLRSPDGDPEKDITFEYIPGEKAFEQMLGVGNRGPTPEQKDYLLEFIEKKFPHDIKALLNTGKRAINIDFTELNLVGIDLTKANLHRAGLEGADLRGAKLRGADLSIASLDGANFAGASLNGANLFSADLRGANLTGAQLIDAKAQHADLTRAVLVDADLSRADLEGAKLRYAKLTGAHLNGANLEGANLFSADLTGAKLRSARLYSAVLTEVNFGANALLDNIVLSGSYLNSAILSGASLVNADLVGAHLKGAKLDSANLRMANLAGAHLKGATLAGADLYAANLAGADLAGSSLVGADLSRAILEGADLDEANLEGANLEYVKYDGYTTWPEGFTPPQMVAAGHTEIPAPEGAPKPQVFKKPKKTGPDEFTIEGDKGKKITLLAEVEATLSRVRQLLK